MTLLWPERRVDAMAVTACHTPAATIVTPCARADEKPSMEPHRAQRREERGATGVSATKRRMVVVIAVLVSLWTGVGWAQALRVVGFNVESGGAPPDVVDDLIGRHRARNGCSGDARP
jgi:hypothetical protein